MVIEIKFTKVLDGRTPCKILFTPDRKMFRSDQVQISRTRWKKGNRVSCADQYSLVKDGPDMNGQGNSEQNRSKTTHIEF